MTTPSGGGPRDGSFRRAARPDATSPRPARGPSAGPAGGRSRPFGEGSARPGTLGFWNIDGQREQWQVSFGEDKPNAPADAAAPGRPPTDPYQVRLVSVPNDPSVYVQKRLPADGLTIDACEPLINEIQIGLHLAWTLGDGEAPELSRIVGYDDGAEEPFILVRERGLPVRSLVGRISDRRDTVQISMLRALSILEAAGVVHRNITPSCVRWDGTTVQISDFRHARFVGEPCPRAPSPRWAAPEARIATCVADPAEDLWSAGLVLVHALDRPRPEGVTPPPDSRTLGAGLDRTLDGVFRKNPTQRPTIEIILDDLGYDYEFVSPNDLIGADGADLEFDEGTQRHDRIRQARGGAGRNRGS